MSIHEKLFQLEKSNHPFVLATIVNISGSVPGKIGFKMITESNGKTTGTIGGGALEVKVKEESLKRLTSNESGTKEYLLSDKEFYPGDNTEVICMSCNGKVWIYYEVHGSLPAVYIFGGGHVGNALLKLLAPLGYHRILIDNRVEFASFEKNPDASEIINEDYFKYAGEFIPLPNPYFVLLTQGHKFDYVILKALYERKIDHKYIGVISSKSKAADMMTRLQNELGTGIDTSKLFMPIGLKLGGNTAAEIALCIAAEMQSIRYGKEEYLLKENYISLNHRVVNK
jgi:xanthine dehydrogenase accessory factor